MQTLQGVYVVMVTPFTAAGDHAILRWKIDAAAGFDHH